MLQLSQLVVALSLIPPDQVTSMLIKLNVLLTMNIVQETLVLVQLVLLALPWDLMEHGLKHNANQHLLEIAILLVQHVQQKVTAQLELEKFLVQPALSVLLMLPALMAAQSVAMDYFVTQVQPEQPEHQSSTILREQFMNSNMAAHTELRLEPEPPHLVWTVLMTRCVQKERERLLLLTAVLSTSTVCLESLASALLAKSLRATEHVTIALMVKHALETPSSLVVMAISPLAQLISVQPPMLMAFIQVLVF